jgi:hypothetical protein
MKPKIDIKDYYITNKSAITHIFIDYFNNLIDIYFNLFIKIDITLNLQIIVSLLVILYIGIL